MPSPAHIHAVARAMYVMTVRFAMLSDGPIKVSDVGSPGLAL